MKPINPTAPAVSVRPLVRYVDESQAVIEVHITVAQAIRGQPLEVHVRVSGPDGYVFDHESHLELEHHTGIVRFEMGDPLRWWPCGMGDQALYDMTVCVLLGDDIADRWQNTIGLTSVRTHARGDSVPGAAPPEDAGVLIEEQAVLLVNGRECSIRSVLPVDPADESGVLPIGEQCLLVIRGHYGPDALYNAADRVGTLLIQSIFTGPGSDEASLAHAQIDRLSGHPSLAGWLVGQTGRAGDRIADRVHELDPTRNIFRRIAV